MQEITFFNKIMWPLLYRATGKAKNEKPTSFQFHKIGKYSSIIIKLVLQNLCYTMRTHWHNFFEI